MKKVILSALLMVLVTSVCRAEQAGWESSRDELQGIDDQVQTLKKEVIQINHELSLLEEKLLFPSTTQISVFVSLVDAKPSFRLDSVELMVDQKPVAKYIYTFRELEALQKGGVQRLHTGNVATGKHELVAVIRGKTAGGNNFEKNATFSVSKDITPKFVEVQVLASGAPPQIKFKDW